MSELQARPGSSTDVRTTGVPQVPGPDPSFPSIRLGPPAGSGAKFNNGSFRTGAPTARRFGQVRSRKRPAGVLYDLGDWSWDCLDDCTAACLGCRTVDHGGSSGYACGCTAAEDPDCRDMVFSPDTPRKASRAGHWGGASCDPGTICVVAAFAHSQGVVVYVSAGIQAGSSGKVISFGRQDAAGHWPRRHTGNAVRAAVAGAAA
jgi:hypothetical protein